MVQKSVAKWVGHISLLPVVDWFWKSSELRNRNKIQSWNAQPKINNFY
jgi:hypothetical protein